MSSQERSQSPQPTKEPVTNNNNGTERPAQQGEEDSFQTISLLTFDPYSKNKRFLSSPRSIEALKRLCFEEHELLIKTKEDFRSQPVPAEFADDKEYYCEVKAEHHEKRRREKLKLAIQERQDIIQEDNKALGAHPKNLQSAQECRPYESQGLSFYSSHHIDNEKKRIQQMKNQQKKEIEFIIQNELKVQEIKKKNEEKVLRLQEIEEKRVVEVEMKHRLAEESKKKREQQKLEREKEEEEIKKAMLQKQSLEEMRRREVQEKIKEQRALESLQKERERKQKAMMKDRKLEILEAQKREEAEKKIEEKDQKLVKIREDFEEKQRRKQIQSEQVRKNFELKIEEARRKYEEEQEEQRQRVLDRQRMTHYKRERFEEEKKHMLEDRRNKSEAKLHEIKKSLDERFIQEHAKKVAYLDKFKKAEENKREREEELEQQRKLKIQREAEKEERLKYVLAVNKKEHAQKNDEFLKSLTRSLSLAQHRKENNIKTVKKKYILDILKAEDVYENNNRLEKMRENKKKTLFDKISIEAQRLQQIQEERERAMMEKKKIQSQLEREKEKVLKEFERNKKLLASKQSPTGMGNMSFDIRSETPLEEPTYKNTQTVKAQSKGASLSRGNNLTQSSTNLHRNMKSALDRPIKESPILEHNETMSTLGNESRPKKITIPPRSGAHQPAQDRKDSSKLKEKFATSPYVKEMNSNTKRKEEKTSPKQPMSSLPPIKEDAVVSDLQTKDYQKESNDKRKEQLGELLKMIDDSVKEDKNEKKLEDNMQGLVQASERQEEDITKIRTDNNYLLFAQ